VPGLITRDRDFRVFWLGQTVSVAGTQVTAVALPLAAAITLHSGPAGVSALATATYLPNVVLPLVAGAWLESRRKRPAMIAADCVRAVALAAVPIAYAAGVLSLPLLAAVALAVGAASVVFDVGSFAFVPSLVDEGDLPGANQAMQGSVTASQVGGPGVAGLIVQLAGPVLGVLLDAVSYVASVLGLLAVRKAELAPTCRCS
jgi:MFS family permease